MLEMLTNEENELLCRTGKGTPMGELFRRYWLPALMCEEIATPDSAPRRLRILGEDLLAFRDSNGRVGIVDAYCPHKLAPLFFGRNEECGLRCVYHGWKFDVGGHCVDIPNLPQTANASALRAKARITAYLVREAGGIVWVYMGTPDNVPPFPDLEWASFERDRLRTARFLQRSNWAQAMEGEIDTSHVSFLHKTLAGPSAIPMLPDAMSEDGAPVVSVKETEYGFVSGARRSTGRPGIYYWRVTHWLTPMFSMIANDPEDQFPRTGRAWVPVDDDHVMVFTYTYRPDLPLTEDHHARFDSGRSFPPHMKGAAFELADGYVIDTFVPVASRVNDYGIDRRVQRTISFTGIEAVSDQDRALQENMRSGLGLGPGRMVDRSREMLLPTDLPVITARRLLIKLAKDLQRGIEPPLPRKPGLYRRRSLAALSSQGSFEAFLLEHESELAPADDRDRAASEAA